MRQILDLRVGTIAGRAAKLSRLLYYHATFTYICYIFRDLWINRNSLLHLDLVIVRGSKSASFCEHLPLSTSTYLLVP